tara:strand:+ start:32 stop:256 length:225 start_codon:yes stop_codon:yes gene_type:complete
LFYYQDISKQQFLNRLRRRRQDSTLHHRRLIRYLLIQLRRYRHRQFCLRHQFLNRLRRLCHQYCKPNRRRRLRR